MIYAVEDVNPAVIEWQKARNIPFMTDSRVAEFFAERGERFIRWREDGRLEVDGLPEKTVATGDDLSPETRASIRVTATS